MEKVGFNLGVNVEFEIDSNFLTDELMDAHDEYFHDVSNDPDYDHLETRKDKHLANISWYLMRGETDFIEGYGKVDSFVKSINVRFLAVDKEESV